MRFVSVMSLVVMTVGVAILGPAPTQASVWDLLLPELTGQISSLWQNNEQTFLGNDCFYDQRPKIKRWELYYVGTFTCPTWTKIRGRAQTRSRSGAMTEAVEHFLTQAHDTGLVTEEEAKAWLERP